MSSALISQTGPGLEQYELIDKYAVGGAAEIYRARNKATNDLVAIKRLRTDVGFDPEMQAGFLRERQLAELSKHKNLIRAFDYGNHGGNEWVALEFIHGRELAKVHAVLKERGEAFPAHLALYVVREVLDGLAFAYNLEDERGRMLGLVHRDLNPRNILVGFAGDVRVCDFGASYASLLEPTPRECVGSLGYLAPEQARCEELDARTDVYAAGLVLLECLTGAPAFPIHKGDAKVLKLHRKGKLGRLPRKLDEEARWILEEALAADPEARYQSASAMRSAIESALGARDEAQLRDELRGLLARLYPHDVVVEV